MRPATSDATMLRMHAIAHETRGAMPLGRVIPKRLAALGAAFCLLGLLCLLGLPGVALAAAGDLSQADTTAGCIELLPLDENNSPCAPASYGAGLATGNLVATYGSDVYVAGASGPIDVFVRSPDGGLTNVQCLDFDGGADGGNANCTEVPQLTGGAEDLVVSPNGKWVYETEEGDALGGEVNVFARDAVSGRLTFVQCLSGNGDDAAGNPGCTTVSQPEYAGRHIAVDPINGEVYSAFLGVITWYEVNVFSGSLTADGCVGTGCSFDYELDTSGDGGLAVSGDGKFLYFAPANAEGVEWLPIESNGSLSTNTSTANGPTAGCVADIQEEKSCPSIRGLIDSNGAIVLSPGTASSWAYLTSNYNGDGASGFGTFPGAVVVLARDPATGALSQSATAAGCISTDGTDGESQGYDPQPTAGPCEQSDPSLQYAQSIAVSPDGQNLYVSSTPASALDGSTDPSGQTVEEFAANDATGALTELGPVNGTYADCYTSIQPESDVFPCTGSYYALAGDTPADYGPPTTVAVAGDGSAVYALSSGDNGLAIFQRTPAPQYEVAAAAALAPESSGIAGTVSAVSGSPAASCDENGANSGCLVYPNATVTLTAVPNSGYRLLSWSGGSCPSVTNPCTVSPVNGAETDTATFVQRFAVAATTSGGGSGSTVAAVDGSPNDPVCSGSTCTVDAGDTVTVTATAATGYRFSGWSGGGCPSTVATYQTSAACTVANVTSNVSVTASFVQQVQVSGPNSSTGGRVVVTVPSSETTASCAGTSTAASCYVDPGSSVIVTAVPDSGFQFSGWSSGSCVTQSPTRALQCTLNAVTANETDAAGFVAGTAPSGNVLYVSPTGSNGGSGTEASPFQTLCYALGVAGNSSGLYTQIVLASGDYNAANTTSQLCPNAWVDLTSADDGFKIYGGYESSTASWQPDPSGAATELDGSPQAVLATGATNVTLENLDLDGTPDSKLSAYGLRAIQGSSLTLNDVHVTAANGSTPTQPAQPAQGASGGAGGPGNAGWGGEGAPCLSLNGCNPSSPDSYGYAGLAGAGAVAGADGGCGGRGGEPGTSSASDDFGDCSYLPTGHTQFPGGPDVLVVDSGSNGVYYAAPPAGRVSYDWTSDYYGTQGSAAAGGGSGGGGGQYYGCVTSYGSCFGSNGGGGGNGAQGAAGGVGAGGTQPGTEGDAWSGGSGSAGGNGQPGGGGGGGAGGSGAYCSLDCTSSWGSGGGGGGGGGAGGTGGAGGLPGGGSFGLYLADSSTVTAQYGSVITAGNGGQGGQGGQGAQGGQGGVGGAGSSYTPCSSTVAGGEVCAGYGGNGGSGGHGGPGGGGGGGEGGPSYAVFSADSGSVLTRSTDTQLNVGSPGVGGLDGNGGTTGAGNNAGGGSVEPANNFPVSDANLPTLSVYALLSGSYVVSTVGCPTSAPGCTGQVTIQGSPSPTGATSSRLVVLATANFSIKGHGAKQVRLKLTAAGRTLVKLLKKRKLTADAATIVVTVKVPHKRGNARSTARVYLVSSLPSPYGSNPVRRPAAG